MTLLIVLTLPSDLYATKRKPAGNSENQLFEFHSGFWINLHHFVYYQALLRNPSNGKLPPNLSDTAAMDILTAAQRKTWLSAIDYYKNNMINKDLLLDANMVNIKNILEEDENKDKLSDTRLPQELATVLNNLSDSYRTFFWKKQNENNQLWISQVQPLINKYKDTLISELGNIYLTPWPKEVIRVDITNYASWSGAYTSIGPNRITISSVDPNNQGVAALEIIFHEASHLLIDKIADDLFKICRQDNKILPRRDLWHAILFYTTGEIIKKHIKSYTPYAYQNGLWSRAWPMYIQYLETDWQPYLKGTQQYDTVLLKLVRDVELSK